MPDFTTVPAPDPTVNTGYRSPDQALALNVVAQVDKSIYWVRPTATPFITMLGAEEAKLKPKDVGYYIHNWMTKAPYPDRVVMAATATAGDTSLTLNTNHGNWVQDNQTLMNLRTGEVLLALATSASAISTAVRGINNAGTGVEMEIGDELLLMAPGYPDASGMGTAHNVQERSFSNRCQIIKHPIQFSGRDIETEFYTGDEISNETKHNTVTFKTQVERTLLKGANYERTHSNGKIQSFCGGLDYFIQQNEWDIGSTEPSERAFVEWLSVVMKFGKGGYLHGNSRKILFCPTQLLTIIEFWAKDRLRILDSFKSKLGLVVMEYVTTHAAGGLRLVHDPALDMFGEAYLVDMNHVRKVFHKGRRYKVLRDQEANDIDGKALQLFVDVSLQVEGSGDGEPHAKIFGEALRS